jgi:hypothetical protein
MAEVAEVAEILQPHFLTSTMELEYKILLICSHYQSQKIHPLVATSRHMLPIGIKGTTT